MRNIEFITNEYYHVFNRGVDRRAIFLDDQDLFRFYKMMYLFNDVNYENRRGDEEINTLLLANSNVDIVYKDKLIRILGFCLRQNHFHLFVEQLFDDGISKFMHKIGSVYSKKFNKKNNRKGTLFEDTFEARHIDHDSYFKHILRYIHLNVLDEEMPEWRQGKICDWEKALNILNSNQWSSHLAYVGIKQQLPIIDEGFINEYFESVDDYTAFLREWAQATDTTWSFSDQCGN